MGKYSFYLHSDDNIDRIAARTIESVSQPLRGDFICMAAIAGGILYQVHTRFPALLTEIFDGSLKVGQIKCQLASLSGQYSLFTIQQDEVRALLPCVFPETKNEYERRRFTLQLPDEGSGLQTARILDNASSRTRGQLLRKLIISGFALHTLDTRFPRLLASMPMPPTTLQAFGELVVQLVDGLPSRFAEAAITTECPKKTEDIQSPSARILITSNMKKFF